MLQILGSKDFPSYTRGVYHNCGYGKGLEQAEPTFTNHKKLLDATELR